MIPIHSHWRTTNVFRQQKNYSLFDEDVQSLQFLKRWLYSRYSYTVKTWNFINWTIEQLNKRWRTRDTHVIYVWDILTLRKRKSMSMNPIASPAQSSIYRGLERFWKIENDLKIKNFWKRRKIDWKLVKKHITRYLRLRRDRLDQNNNAPSFCSTGWVPVRVPWKKVFWLRRIQLHKLQNPWKLVFEKLYMCFFGVVN